MRIPAKVRLSALALNNLGISFIQRCHDEQAFKAFEDALTIIAAMVRLDDDDTSEYSLSSSIDTIMTKASSAIIDITENTCSSSFQIVTIDDIAQTVQKVIQDGSKPSYPIFIRMEIEGTLQEICEYEDPIVETAVILYNFASAYKFLATTKKTTRTLQNHYFECAIRLFELLLSAVDSNPTVGETSQDGCGLEHLAFSILALHGLIVCSTMNNASMPLEENCAKKLSVLQEEFLANEGMIKLFLDSSFRMAGAA